ncbi:hypothetical protein AVEN_71394-1 [Araneus ventricosus]|uniref:RNase H type-1 domain-containing protein n=1 Tax=Araneus ventricosus TaxID=182803 RepID=A0A4Y2BI59_ARAVE|nr:hypothetical protein AVEN_71394-1 [Araneus ventricosus]
MALKSASYRSSFVISAKNDLSAVKGLVGLSWVKAHVGIQGNEWADQQAKSAISTGVGLDIPDPRSYLRRKLKAGSPWASTSTIYCSRRSSEKVILWGLALRVVNVPGGDSERIVPG